MTNQPFSFTSFLDGSQQRYQNAVNGNTAVRRNAPSEKMVKFYYDLCQRKNIKPQDINAFTMQALSKEIEEMRNLPDAPSARQIEAIHSLLEEIKSLGGNIRLTPNFITLLDGAKASAFIQTLKEKRTQLNEFAPPSEAQLKILVEWYLCPDIPFEDYRIEKRVYLDQLSSYSTDVDTPEKLEKRLWRMLTPTEFADQITKRMTKREANAFIDAHRGKFYDWRKTRATNSQINYIREMESRLANLNPAPMFRVTEDGAVEEFHFGSARDRQGQPAYIGLEDIHLAQMSQEQASAHIDMLKSELENRELRSIGSAYDDTQQRFQDKHASFQEGLNNQGKAKDASDARLREYTAVNDLIYKLEAVAGYSYDALHDMIKEVILDGADVQSQTAREEIKSFMYATIDMSNEEQKKHDIGRLYMMTEESIFATDIVSEIASELFAD